VVVLVFFFFFFFFVVCVVVGLVFVVVVGCFVSYRIFYFSSSYIGRLLRVRDSKTLRNALATIGRREKKLAKSCPYPCRVFPFSFYFGFFLKEIVFQFSPLPRVSPLALTPHSGASGPSKGPVLPPVSLSCALGAFPEVLLLEGKWPSR